MLTQTHVARVQRGAGRPAFDALGYFAEQADAQLDGAEHLLLVDCPPPVAFFAYPGRPSSLVPEGCAVHSLGADDEDVVGALEALADMVAPDAAPVLVSGGDAAVLIAGASPDEPLGPRNVGLAVGAVLPEGAIVVEESITSRLGMAGGTVGAAPHDWLALTGGAIGEGMPLATGAAVACPDRKVVNLQADGSAMYTIQSLWTQARRRLDVTTVILSNRAYAILQVEMQRIVGQQPGPRGAATLDLSGPELDFSAIANGMGVPSLRARTVGELTDALARAMSEAGPFLIDAVLA
ncbi:MAG: acetolactate synthase large subunit [Ilumatobacteraceae bacterium]